MDFNVLVSLTDWFMKSQLLHERTLKCCVMSVSMLCNFTCPVCFYVAGVSVSMCKP